jgi:hypothetical protein
MHLRRIALFLLGGWLVGSVLILFVSSANYEAADAVLRSPPPQAAKVLSILPSEQGRMLLFFVASEASRSYSTVWEPLQSLLGIGTAGALFLDRRTRFYSAGIGLMLLLVFFEWLVILPQLDWLGRSIDFVSWKVYSSTRDQYWNLRAVYLGVGMVKLLVGAGVVAALLVMRTRSRGSRHEIGEAESGETVPGRSSGGRRRSGGSGQHTARA